jgi:hypothetical protein
MMSPADDFHAGRRTGPSRLHQWEIQHVAFSQHGPANNILQQTKLTTDHSLGHNFDSYQIDTLVIGPGCSWILRVVGREDLRHLEKFGESPSFGLSKGRRDARGRRLHASWLELVRG